MKVLSLILIFISLVHVQVVNAEYRVYQYIIKPKTKNLNDQFSPTTIVTSSLDPKAYMAYNGGSSSIDLTLVRSWMCYGSTAQQAPCLPFDEEVTK